LYLSWSFIQITRLGLKDIIRDIVYLLNYDLNSNNIKLLNMFSVEYFFILIS